MILNQTDNPKLRKYDRILVVKPTEGEKPKSSTGLVDSRLFKGGNSLHAIFNEHHRLWYLKYSDGILPQALKQRFTTFVELLDFTKKYFNRRGLEIAEVID